MSTTMTIILIITAAFVLAGIAFGPLLFYSYKTQKYVKEKRSELVAAHPHYTEEQLFLKCRAYGVESIISKRDKERLKLVAKNLNCSALEMRLCDMFETGKKEVTAQEEREYDEYVKSFTKAIHDANGKYAECTGPEKGIQMCQDMASLQRTRGVKSNSASPVDWDQLAERFQYSLFDCSKDQNELLGLLGLCAKVGAPQNGTVVATVKTSEAWCTIFEDNDAIVDGSIRAKLKSGEKIIAETMFHLPIYGSSRKNEIRVVFPVISNPPQEPQHTQEYTVSFEPFHLWAQEYQKSFQEWPNT